MFFETIQSPSSSPAFDSSPLPAELVLTQRAAAVLRAYLSENELGHYRIFDCSSNELYDVEFFLAQLGEADATWEPAPPFVAGGDGITTVTIESEKVPRLWDCGILRLAKHEVVIARWYWIDDNGLLSVLNLFAAHTPGHFARL